jgi:hypothetical protein
MPGHIGREQHEICARLIAFEVFTLDSALQGGEVVSLSQFVCRFLLLSGFLHVRGTQACSQQSTTASLRIEQESSAGRNARCRNGGRPAFLLLDFVVASLQAGNPALAKTKSTDPFLCQGKPKGRPLQLANRPEADFCASQNSAWAGIVARRAIFGRRMG